MQAEQQIPEEDLLPLTPLSQIREALHEEDLAEVGEIVNELKPAEIARMLESLPPIEREQVWETVDDEYNGEVLAHLSESVLEDIVDEMSHEELLQTAASMPSNCFPLWTKSSAPASHKFLNTMKTAPAV